MLKAVQIKILLAFLAALVAIGGYLCHEHEVNVRAAAATARAAALLQQQRNDAEAAKKHNAETWDFVRKQRQKHNTNPVNGSKTWSTYVP